MSGRVGSARVHARGFDDGGRVGRAVCCDRAEDAARESAFGVRVIEFVVEVFVEDEVFEGFAGLFLGEERGDEVLNVLRTACCVLRVASSILSPES